MDLRYYLMKQNKKYIVTIYSNEKRTIYSKTYQIVVAKYKEDIEWITYLDKSKVYIWLSICIV